MYFFLLQFNINVNNFQNKGSIKHICFNQKKKKLFHSSIPFRMNCHDIYLFILSGLCKEMHVNSCENP